MPTIDIDQYPETIEAFGGDRQRATVFLDRYAKKTASGEVAETLPADMWERVSIAIGKDGEQTARFRELLEDFKFVPGGRILAGAGTGAEVTFYNCYVIPVETKHRRQSRGTVLGPQTNDPGNDSREAIFDTIGLMVDIMSRGGGVGINWSVLRPKGAHLKRVNGTTSGPVSWMDVASRAVGVVEQGGSRRGAAMFMLDIWHPDVLEFIDAKRDFSLITNANVSVAVSDDFMECVREGRDWVFEFPETDDDEYDRSWDGDLAGWKARGGATRHYASMPARRVWEQLAAAAWASGEPGVVFLDRYNAQSTGAGRERLISVNPCGEQGLGAYSVCNLGSMNLAAYVENDHRPFSRVFDFARFGNDVGTAIEFLDRCIDVNHYFIPENEAVQKDLRRVGLGVMGLADALIALGIRYGSKEAVEFTDRVFETMKRHAVARSAGLARNLGPAPAWDYSMVNRPFLAELPEPQVVDLSRSGLRNIFLLTQAPTGTTSILAGVNSGIEPLFATSYTRTDRTGTHKVKAPALGKYVQSKYTDVYPDYVVTAADVAVEEHIAMQAAVQRHIDSSVSKTINAPNSHTVEDVKRAYTLAYDFGLKGLAYFRDGCGREQVLTTSEDPKLAITEHPGWCDELGVDYRYLYEDALRALEETHEELSRATAALVETPRPEVLRGTTRKVQSKHGSVYVTVNRDETGRAIEVFFAAGKVGEETMVMAEALGRLASLALRKGATLGGVANQLEGIGGQTNIAWNKSLPHTIGVALTAENRAAEEAEDDSDYDDADDELVRALMSGGGLSFEPDDDWALRVSEPVLPEAASKAIAETLVAPVPSFAQMGQRRDDPCPNGCGGEAVREEGCMKCHTCGWSAC